MISSILSKPLPPEPTPLTALPVSASSAGNRPDAHDAGTLTASGAELLQGRQPSPLRRRLPECKSRRPQLRRPLRLRTRQTMRQRLRSPLPPNRSRNGTINRGAVQPPDQMPEALSYFDPASGVLESDRIENSRQQLSRLGTSGIDAWLQLSQSSAA